MMLLAAAAAEVGECCFAFIFCLAVVWQAAYKMPRILLFYHLTEPAHSWPKPNVLCVHFYFYTQIHTTTLMTAVTHGRGGPWVLH